MSSFGKLSPFKNFHKGALTVRPKRGTDGLPDAQFLTRRNISRESERWWLLDVKGLQVREAAKIAAFYLSAQHKPDFQPRVVSSDQVVIINAKEAVMVGDTWSRYPITWNTNYAGGKYRVRASAMYERDPCLLLWNFIREEVAFNQMTRPFSNQGRGYYRTKNMMEFVWLYEDAVHPHADQAPRPILWEAETRPFYYQNKFLQPRWKIGQFTA